MHRLCRDLSFLLLLLSTAAFSQTTTLSAATANSTAACGSTGQPSYCEGTFSGMSDSNGFFNAVPGNVSTEDVHELLYPGATTSVLAHFQPWFCMGNSSSTGTGTLCGQHIQVGYNSADRATVHGQVNDMLQRGLNGLVVDYYGTALNSGIFDTVTQYINDDVSNRCSGAQSCPFYYALMYDQGAFQWTGCPQNGNGVDQTQCIISAMSSDFDYMNANYFGSAGYARYSASSNQISNSGSPLVFFFVCEECFTNPAPNWPTVWSSLQQHVQSYGSNTPVLYFLFRNAGGFTHEESDGGFAWVNWSTSDPYGNSYLTGFYSAAASSSALLTVGANWKGFDESSAPWVTSDPRFMSQQCGTTWLQTMHEISNNSNFGSSRQLPFTGLVTWNDYEEGTELETGINNCLSLSGTVTGNMLTWTLSFSDPSGSESTVHHYLVYDSVDGENLTQLAKISAGTHSLDLSQFDLSPGAHTLYVKAVGQPFILNQMSTAVSYTVQSPPTLQSLVLNPAAVPGGSASSATITLTQPAPQGGVSVSLSSSSSVAMVPGQVAIAAGTTNATFNVSTSAVATTSNTIITASLASQSISSTLTVTAPKVSAISISPSSLGGSACGTLTVALNAPAPATGLVVQLSSSSTAATSPASVTIPSGSVSAKVTVCTKTVLATTSAKITAQFGGSAQSATLTINVTPSSITFSSNPVTGSTKLTGTITLTGDAPSGGETVSLNSSSSYASVPHSVTVASGAKIARFTITVTKPRSKTNAAITATGFGVGKSGTLTINP